MGRSKNAKESNEKNWLFIIYQNTKVQNLGSPKIDKVEKT
jgi:hypothetical protein